MSGNDFLLSSRVYPNGRGREHLVAQNAIS